MTLPRTYQKVRAMNQITDLISRASHIVGSDYALATQLDVPRQMISGWKKGARPCPPEDQARIAEIAGFDPMEALVNAHIERHAGTPKGEALCRTLGKWLPRNKYAPDIASEALNWRKRR